MLFIPKKQDFPWGYQITWASGLKSDSKILHINKEKVYKWSYKDDIHQAIHCLFGSVYVVTYDKQEKIWPGESYTLDSNVKEIKAGVEDAEILLLTEKN